MRRPALALLLGCLLLVAGASADSADPWWDNNWEKRVPLTVTNASATEGMQALYNVTYDSDMQSDFDDLRFVQDDGSTPIDYWIETKSDSNYAQCWLKLPANETLVYLYYSNPDAESESDVDAVMEFGDDFPGTSLNTTKWMKTAAGVSVADGVCTVAHGGSQAYIYGKTSFGTGYILRFQAKISAGTTVVGQESHAATTQSAYVDMINSAAVYLGSGSSYGGPYYHGVDTTSAYRVVEIIRTGGATNHVICTIDGAQVVDSTSYASTTMRFPIFHAYAAGTEVNVKSVAVRKYAAVEPTLSAGSEESSSSAPTAAFTATPTAGLAPLTVQFTDTSTGSPTSWLWNFGDGNTSTDQNPQHTYAAPGTYSVTLTATNEYGSDYELKTDYITVYGPVSAQFTATPTGGTAPLTVQFTDLSTGGPTSWSWTFGDGNTSTAQNPQHTYTTAGTHTVTLTASHPYDTDTETKPACIIVAVLQPFPGLALIPRDLAGNGLYTDINGNGRLDYNDLTVFFQHLSWAKTAQPIACFDFNGNGWLDYNDVITLFSTIMEEHT